MSTIHVTVLQPVRRVRIIAPSFPPGSLPKRWPADVMARHLLECVANPAKKTLRQPAARKLQSERQSSVVEPSRETEGRHAGQIERRGEAEQRPARPVHIGDEGLKLVQRRQRKAEAGRDQEVYFPEQPVHLPCEDRPSLRRRNIGRGIDLPSRFDRGSGM